MDLEAGQLVDDRYEVLRLAGSGEWHQLYEVADRSSGERFGLKIIDQAAARNAKRREDFLRQVQVARKLEHRNLLAVVGQGEHQGAPYLLTEHAPGESLAALLARQGRLSAQELARDVGCSVSTVRKALQTLEADGWIRRWQSRGGWDTRARLAQLSEKGYEALEARRDLIADRFVTAGAVLSYQDECAGFEFYARRRFTESDRSPEGTTVGLRVRLFGAGGDRSKASGVCAYDGAPRK